MSRDACMCGMCGEFHKPTPPGKCFFKNCDYLKTCCQHCLVKYKDKYVCAQHLEVDMYDRAIMVLEELESRKKMYEEVMEYVNVAIKEKNYKKREILDATLNNQCLKCGLELQDLVNDEFIISDGICYFCHNGLPSLVIEDLFLVPPASPLTPLSPMTPKTADV